MSPSEDVTLYRCCPLQASPFNAKRGDGTGGDETVGTIDLGTNSSEPTSESGLGNWENLSEPTTPLPSPQYGKAEASESPGGGEQEEVRT